MKFKFVITYYHRNSHAQDAERTIELHQLETTIKGWIYSSQKRDFKIISITITPITTKT